MSSGKATRHKKQGVEPHSHSSSHMCDHFPLTTVGFNKGVLSGVGWVGTCEFRLKIIEEPAKALAPAVGLALVQK